jgi:hypothetical protein
MISNVTCHAAKAAVVAEFSHLAVEFLVVLVGCVGAGWRGSGLGRADAGEAWKHALAIK